jgi:RNA polymerase sigma-70 factor (ECF subfamily)
VTRPLPPRAGRPEVDDIVARIRAGDAAAFAWLFDSYYAALCSFAHSYVKDPAVADDVVQEVFYALWRRRDTWAPAGVRAYLFAAVRNRAVGALRHDTVINRAAEQCAADGERPGMGSAPRDGHAAAEATDLQDAFRRAVHRLPERLRLVVSLRWQHDCSHAEIARVMGITVKGVESQLTRALKRIRAELGAFTKP